MRMVGSLGLTNFIISFKAMFKHLIVHTIGAVGMIEVIDALSGDQLVKIIGIGVTCITHITVAIINQRKKNK